MMQTRDPIKKPENSLERRRPEEHQAGSTFEWHPLLHLQRAAGNRAVAHMLASYGNLQTKLRTDLPGDEFEHEADTATLEVSQLMSAPVGVIQRKCATCSPTFKCAECEEEERVQRKAKASGPATAPRIQRASRNGDSATPEATGETEPEAARTLLVEDDAANVAPGQMRKGEFLEQLRSTVCTTADEALAEAGQSTQGCPYIEQWLSYYTEQPPAHIERALRKYAPEAATATSAQDYIPAVSNRVRRAVQRWASTGEITGVPDELAGMMSGAGALGAVGGMIGGALSGIGSAIGSAFSAAAGAVGSGFSSVGKALFKRKEGQAASNSPAEIQQQLNDGQPLDGQASSRMSAAFGHDFSGVRVHTDASAAGLSDSLNARAFTIGSDIAFSAGEYQPGTLIGDALIAHELAHVVQQHGAAPEIGSKSDGEADDASLEDAADESAVGAVVSLWGDKIEGLKDVGRNAKPRLKSGLRLQRCGGCSGGPRRDQRAGTTLPDTARQAGIRGQLHPTSSGIGGVAVPWDGASALGVVSAAAAANRTALKTSLTAALNAHLAANMPGINAVAGRRRLPMSSFEGAGRAAQQVTDAVFSSWMAVAAMTPSQLIFHRDFQFRGAGPGQNLFDAYDPAQRAATGHAIDPDDLASWIAETDTAAQAAAAAHNFDPNRGGEEQTFLTSEVLTPFVAANRPDLEKYDRFGFAISGSQIVAPSSVAGGFSDVAGIGGQPSPAERAAKWEKWRLLVHEYIHTLEHPAFHSAARGNRIMIEGFCEMFTKEVLVPAETTAPADSSLRQLIDGGDYGQPPAAIVGTYSPGDYASYLAHAENIRDVQIGPPGGDNAVKSAFFQGHVEFLGLNPDGSEAAPAPAGGSDLITVPAGTGTIANLASLAGVGSSVITTANPGVPAAGPLPAQMHVPGARDHIVVEASDTLGVRTTETKAQIAAQNGISESDLQAANPTVVWAGLTVGQRILIPKH